MNLDRREFLRTAASKLPLAAGALPLAGGLATDTQAAGLGPTCFARIEILCNQIRRCAMSDGLLNQLPIRVEADPVLVDPYFTEYGLLALLAQCALDPASRAKNLPAVKNWLIRAANLMAPTAPLDRNVIDGVDLTAGILRSNGTLFQGSPQPQHDTQLYYSLGRYAGQYDKATNLAKLAGRQQVGTDAHDSAAALYLLVALHYSVCIGGNRFLDSAIRRGAIAAFAILKACAIPGFVFSAFFTRHDLQLCLDNFEVAWGLQAAATLFANYRDLPGRAMSQQAAVLLEDLTDVLNVFEFRPPTSVPYFQPLPNESTPLGGQPSHDYTNLTAIARLAPLPFRNSLFNLSETTIPFQASSVEDPAYQYIPYWCMAVNATTLGNMRKRPYRIALADWVERLIEQHSLQRLSETVVNNQTRMIGRYSFQIQDYALAVLALISTAVNPSHFPWLPPIAYVPRQGNH